MKKITPAIKQRKKPEISKKSIRQVKKLVLAIHQVLRPLPVKQLLAAGLLGVTPAAVSALPVVVNQTPAVNARTALPTDSIIVDFNTPLKAASVTSNSFVVRGSLSGSHSGTLNVDGAQVTLTSDKHFIAGETVTVVLTTAIQDTNHISLATPQVWQFTIKIPISSAVFADNSQALGSATTRDVALGDVDGDGDLDAFTANYAGQANRVWLNNGAGSFTDSGQALGAGAASLSYSSSQAVVMADLDADGDQDVFVANTEANRVWFNNGVGIFSDSGQQLGNTNTQSIALGDVDGDGDPDAWVTNSDGAGRVWLNDGFGFFTDSSQGSLGSSNSRDVILGDVDGDGDLDALMANTGANRMWLNNGAGIFTDSGQRLGNADSASVALGDVDGDGDLDVVFANAGANRMWLNNGAGIFTDSGQSLGNADSVAAALSDADGDGDPDAWFSNAGGQADRLWLNDGAGNFSDSGQALGSADSAAVALGDMDGNGSPDAWVANAGANRVWLNAQPLLVSTSTPPTPVRQALDIPANSNIVVTFEKAVDTATVNSHNFVVIGSLSGPVSGVFSTVGDTVTFTPAPAFAPGETVTVILTTALAATDGAALNAPVAWQFTVAGAFAAGNFLNSGQNLGNTSSRDVALGDVDHDGDLDAWVANADGQADRVWLNDGSAGFTDSGQSLGSLGTSFGYSSATGVALADVDGDGDLDAFVINAVTQPNQVWLNDGTGNFSDSGQTLESSLGSSASADVALGDVDGDGDADAFLANARANRVWLNDGSGVFTGSGQSLGSSASTAVRLGDVDGDGDLDAFVVNSAGEANRVWLNDGAGTFTDSGQNLGWGGLSLGYSSSYGIALGDVDADGDPDAFVANAGANRVWLNNGSGIFTDSGQRLGNADSAAVTLMDVDGDGDLDAWVANAGANQVWLNDGAGVFTANGQDLGTADSAAVVTGDLDGDGDVDAWVANSADQANQVWLNLEPLTLSSSTPPTPLTNDTDALQNTDVVVIFEKNIDAATVNSNSFIVIGSLSGPISGSFTTVADTVTFTPTADFAAGETVTVTLSTTLAATDNSTLAAPRTWQFTVAAPLAAGTFVNSNQSLGSSDSRGITLGDVNGDGHPDAVVANTGGNRVWLNDGSGGFTDSSQNLGSADSAAIALGDVDGDGDLDAFAANADANRVWLNNGFGTLSDSGQSLGLNAQSTGYSVSHAVTLGDVDNDGDLDAVTANAGANHVFLNDGSGIFTATGQHLENALSQGVALGDVDDDGDLDILFANADQQPDRVWFNNGFGLFTDSGQNLGWNGVSQGYSASYGISLGDVDGDGDLDAVTANAGPNQVLLNDGSGFFTDSGQNPGNSTSTAIKLADMDGDGDLDMLTANSDGLANRVWLNDGAGIFTDSGQTPGANSQGIATGDVDGDGDLDVMTAHNSGQANRLWRNTTPLRIVSMTPVRHDTHAPGNSDITVIFEKAVASAGVHSGSFIVIGAESGPVAGTLNTVADSVTFSPAADFRPGETVTVILTTAITATDGAALIAPQTWQFTVQAALAAGNFLDSDQYLGNTDSREVALGDVDGDGDADAWVVNYGLPNRVWFNNGGGAFTDSGQLLGSTGGASLTSSSSSGVALGDVDGDGDVDAMVANLGANQLWLNNGSGTFSNSGQDLGSADSFAIRLGDVDGDGDLDAVTANAGTGRVWLNNGAGIFSDSGQGLLANATRVNLGDVDNDGDLDAFFVAATTNRVWLNNGAGLFSDSTQQVGNASGDQNVTLGDVDGDGDLDAILANSGSGNQLWHNDGSGIFTNSGWNPGNADSRDIALGDVDGDGDLDAWLANGQANHLWLNDGSGTFTDSGQSLGGADSAAVVLSDVDGDGDLDAWVANATGNRVWLNLQPLTLSPSIPPAPAQNDPAALQGSDIVVTFAKAIDAATVNSNSVVVVGNLSGRLSGTLNVVTDTVTFNPATDFKAGETITVTLTTALAATDGTRLAAPRIWQFTVAAPTVASRFVNSNQSLGNSASQGITLGDVNNDGHVDAFVANAGANRVWLNTGNGTLVDSGQNPGSADSSTVALGDMDGDSDPDAFIVNAVEADRVWLNNGFGTFTDSGQNLGSNGASLGYSAGYGVTLGDVDGDGDLDAVVANAGANHVLRNNGAGTFTDSGQNLGDDLSRDIALGDVDSDGDLDIWVANAEEKANRVWLNDGFGGFTDSGQDLGWQGPSAGYSSSNSVALGDVDGDGDLDALVANAGPNQVFFNDGNGIFTDSGQALGEADSAAVVLADVDGDGDLDALVANGNGQASTVWLNDGTGTFSAAERDLGDADSRDLAVADMDSDGDPDVMFANAGTNSLWLNIEPLRLSEAIPPVPAPNDVDALAGGDIVVTFAKAVNGATVDSHSFIVTGSLSGPINGTFSVVTNTVTFDPATDFQAGETVTVLLTTAIGASDGTPLATPQTWQFTVQAAAGPGIFLNSGQALGNAASRDVSLGDVDGDGDPDIVVANSGQSNQVWLNDGTGIFTSALSTASMSYSSSTGVALGDVDGDGDPDAWFANQGPNEVWFNDGTGVFTDSGQILGSAVSAGVALGDVDGDGDADAVVANAGASRVWLNNGLGTFADSGQSLLATAVSQNVSLGDVDNDGDLDAFFATDTANRLWRNDGGGIFTDSGQQIGSEDAQETALGDVDGDGDLDVVIANRGAANRVWLNDGSGIFTDSGQAMGNSDTGGVTLSDVEGDGDLDILFANLYGQANRVWLNDGNGIFTDSGQNLGSSDSEAVAAGDVDGDGDPDMVVAANDGANRVWLNTFSNQPPVAANLAIGGTLLTGQTLIGSYTYSDPDGHAESGTLYQWVRADDNAGANAIDISGATGQSYLLSATDLDKFVMFCVIPSDGRDAGNETCSDWSGPIAGVVSPSGLITPTDGATLDGSTVTFIWQGSDVQNWWLYVGSTPGGTQYFNSGSLSATVPSIEVTGLPVNGSTVYARFWYQDSLGWHSLDYSYTTPIEIGMVTPEDGDTLPGSDVTFIWQGADILQWWLYVGNTVGGKQYFDSGILPGTTTSIPVTGLPVDGSLVYARLWYQDTLGWHTMDYSYVAYSLPEMVTPVPGSMLPGSDVLFTWQGSNIQQWWLTLGTLPGSGNLFNSGSLGTATSVQVTGLPMDGSTIHARLWYGGEYLDYVYTAYIGGPPAMTAPTDPLPGSNVTFSWDGAGIQQAWLYIGTAVGTNNLFNSGNLGAASSVDVTGLPINGSTLYVRLWYDYGGGWQSVDYIYTAATQ